MKVLAQNTVAAQRAVQCSVSTINQTVSRSAFAGNAVAPLRRSAKVVASRQCSSRLTMAFFGGGAKSASTDSIYDIKVETIDGKTISMDKFKGKVLLIANVASACGFTPQYLEFAELYDKYKGKGFEVVAFPCNSFGAQEAGSNSQIKAFAQSKGAKFTLLAKGEVNGPGEQPLWTYLKSKQSGLLNNDIKWNFSKFLVDKTGKVVARYPPTTTPLSIEKEITALL